MPGEVNQVTVPAGAPVSALAPGEDGLVWHTLRADQVLQAEHVDEQHGLSSAEAASRAERFGSNAFDAGKAEPRWRAFLRQYTDLMQIVLLAAGLLSLGLQEWETGIVLILLTLFNAVLGLQQEGKAAAAVAALQQMMIIKARVRRDGQLREIPAEQLVPGNIVSIEAGDIVPADGRLLRAATLEVAESALTGESLPVAKDGEPVEGTGTPLGDRTDMVYMNTNVTRGSGEFVVTATGMATEVGHISGMLQGEQAVKTPLTRQLDKLTRQILWIAGFALIVSMILNLARGDTFTAVFTAAVAFAVGAIPENLPAVVTAILASGTQALARVGAIMKRLQSTETLGSTSAINSDKTGTLTLNQMTAVQMALVGRRYTIEGKGYAADGPITRVAGEGEIPLDDFLLPMVLASDAVVSDGELIGDPTEGALVVLAVKGGIDAAATRERYPRVAELPFDAAYKLMATFHKMTDASGNAVIRCYVKGAPDQLLVRAGTVFDADAGPLPVDGRARDLYLAENQRLGEQGLRVLATARKDFDPAAFDPGADLLPLLTGLELLALVGIVDPPRPTAKASIATGQEGRRQGPDDHRRSRRYRCRDRPPARHRRHGDHRRRVRGHERRRGAGQARRHRGDRPGDARAQGQARGPAQASGAHRGDDRRRGQRRARAEEGRYRDRDGDHRHRGDQGSRGDDPDRRQLLHHRQGGGARPRAVQQPGQVRPVPDGLPVRLHRLVPRRQHLQHRRGRSVPAAADPVDQLHHLALPGDRAGLRPARRGA